MDNIGDTREDFHKIIRIGNKIHEENYHTKIRICIYYVNFDIKMCKNAGKLTGKILLKYLTKRCHNCKTILIS